MADRDRADRSTSQPRDDPSPNRFAGFERPTSNYFRMPNSWTDITAEIDSLAELKVVEYILRHTWGYQEYDILKHITIDEFMHGRLRRDATRMDSGTGLSEQSIRNGLSKALADALIEEEVDDSDRGRVKKYYRLRMAADGGAGVQTLDSGVQTLDPEVKVSRARGTTSSPRSWKETLDINHEKDTAPPGTEASPALRALWQTAADSLGQEMTAANFQQWIAPLELVELANSHAVLHAPTSAIASYVGTRLADKVASALGVERVEVRTP